MLFYPLLDDWTYARRGSCWSISRYNLLSVLRRFVNTGYFSCAFGL